MGRESWEIVVESVVTSILPYQESPVCWSNVDWDQEEAAIKTWTIWSFEEASMVLGDGVVIVR